MHTCQGIFHSMAAAVSIAQEEDKTMRKTFVMAAALFACGPQAFKDQARDALPSKSTVQMGSPQASSQASQMSGSPNAIQQDNITWGPSHGPFDYNEYKLVVTKDGDSFDWQLSSPPRRALPTSAPGGPGPTRAIPACSSGW
jgi:hypothetical protein